MPVLGFPPFPARGKPKSGGWENSPHFRPVASQSPVGGISPPNRTPTKGSPVEGQGSRKNPANLQTHTGLSRIPVPGGLAPQAYLEATHTPLTRQEKPPKIPSIVLFLFA